MSTLMSLKQSGTINRLCQKIPQNSCNFKILVILSPLIRNDSGKELAQSPVANDSTVNILHRRRLKYAKNLIIGHLKTNS